MDKIIKLLKKYGRISNPPRTLVEGSLVYTEDKFLLGKVHS